MQDVGSRVLSLRGEEPQMSYLFLGPLKSKDYDMMML